MKKLAEGILNDAERHGSIPFWSWNDKLEDEELRRQIRNMKALGMRGFFMHARGGLETEYMSEDWFKAINVCIDEAGKLGMEAWAYDENGWPSGFAGGELLKDSRNFAKYLTMSESYEFPEPDDDIIGVYTVSEGKCVRVTAPCHAEKYFVIHRKSDFSYVDTLDGEVTDKFIAATHEVYKRSLPEKASARKCRASLPMSRNISVMERRGRILFLPPLKNASDMMSERGFFTFSQTGFREEKSSDMIIG